VHEVLVHGGELAGEDLVEGVDDLWFALHGILRRGRGPIL
jgi:hypothetical protein